MLRIVPRIQIPIQKPAQQKTIPWAETVRSFFFFLSLNQIWQPMKTKKQFLHTIGENLKFGKNNDRIKIYQTAINERESPRNKHHIVKMIVSTNDKKNKTKKKKVTSNPWVPSFTLGIWLICCFSSIILNQPVQDARARILSTLKQVPLQTLLILVRYCLIFTESTTWLSRQI